MADQIRMGIVGAGYFALGAHGSAIQAHANATVTAVCRRDKELLAKAKDLTGADHAYTNWQEMLESGTVDAVVICTPNNLHCQQSLAALEQGIDVLVEKPMALSSIDAVRMVDAAKSSIAKLMVGYNRRCSPVWRSARKMIAEGAIGTIRQIGMTSFFNTSFFWDPK